MIAARAVDLLSNANDNQIGFMSEQAVKKNQLGRFGAQGHSVRLTLPPAS
jgi:hypothetical protein